MGEPVPILDALRELAGETSKKQPRIERRRLPPCKTVFIDVRNRWSRLPFWQPVSRGTLYGRVKFLYASPSPCILTPNTSITFSKSCDYKVERATNNVIVREYCGGKKDHVYVYPANVWDELFKYYIEPMLNGEEPFNTGVLLIGAPGTGKSRLAKIAGMYAGLNTYTIDTSMLSKYVGESEKTLKNIINEARSNQPSLIILDDAEWILLARKLAGDEQEGLSRVRLHLQQILFSSMQEIYDNGERVLFIATTNYRQDILDQALVRHGRFGPPLLLPLPDLEAAKIIVRDILRDRSEEEIERIAFTAVNAGLSVADTIALAERVKRGGEPIPRTVGGRGYSRIFVERVDGFDVLEKKYNIPLKKLFSHKSRISILGNEDVATALAVQMIYAAGKTVIKITDIRYLDEAIHSANMLGSVLITPSRLHEEVQYYIADNADVSVVFVGDKPSQIPTFMLGSTDDIAYRVGVEPSIKSVAALKGIKIPPGIIDKIRRKTRGDKGMLNKVLNLIAVTGFIDENYFENMLAWI